MSLVDSWEKQGNYLFKYRGQFPVLLFLIAIPFLYCTPQVDSNDQLIWNIVAVLICILGFVIRLYTIGTTPKGTSGRNTKEQIADILNSTGIYQQFVPSYFCLRYLLV